MQSAFEAAHASFSYHSLLRRSSLRARFDLSAQRRPFISPIWPKLILAEAIANPLIGAMVTLACFVPNCGRIHFPESRLLEFLER
jgi:hypothetical protein